MRHAKWQDDYCTRASRTSSRNVHAKIQISDLNSVHSSLVIYNTNYKRQTNQQQVQPETSLPIPESRNTRKEI